MVLIAVYMVCMAVRAWCVCVCACVCMCVCMHVCLGGWVVTERQGLTRTGGIKRWPKWRSTWSATDRESFSRTEEAVRHQINASRHNFGRSRTTAEEAWGEASYHHTVQVAQVQGSVCTSGWTKKDHQCKLQRVKHHLCKWTISASGYRKKHHQRKLQLVTTTTCASGVVAPVERRASLQAQGAKVRMLQGTKVWTQGAKVRASIGSSRYGMQHNMQLQPPPPSTR